MYQVKPMCGGDVKVDLPTCMYKLANIHERPLGDTCTHEHAPLQNGMVDPSIKALETRQDEIMRKLYELKAAVEGLAKTVTTPNADMDLTVSSSLSSQSASFPVFKGSADLDMLLGKDHGALHDIVINANPAKPPFTLLVLHNLLSQRYRVLSTVHIHSSISSVPPQLLSCLGPRHPDSYARHLFQLGFTLIWKDVPKLQMKFSVQNMSPIEGEASVARFLFKLLAPYPSNAALATLVDDWVDTAFLQLAEGSAKERATVVRALNSALDCDPWLVGCDVSLADVACYCCLLLSGAISSSVPANVQRWLESCENLGYFAPAKVLLQ
ncbi:aminoacyl tRNA synthase complex-interacting multifunctional protein 2 [Syngnathoides biaculeatus]|uniref:aminoacyl tRNA synthase complex-interacting multifunctional protein 2 n=1 Tax=Syngnathoides biaculeatus TaxID=300417 RepID=UPI002ADD613D|nr:aminoacyl tRNA synthase complex-interacting multifunctional protein 2 [Syngnathoides biaculeatus]